MATLTDHDRAALAEAAALIQDVVLRHPMEVSGVVATHVQFVVHGIELVRKDFEELL